MNDQTLVSPPLKNRWPITELFAGSFCCFVIAVSFGLSGPIVLNDLIEVNGTVISVAKRHNRYDYLIINIKNNKVIKSVEIHSYGESLRLYAGLKVGNNVQILAKNDSGTLKALGLVDNGVQIRSVDQVLIKEKRDYVNSLYLLVFSSSVMFLLGWIGLIKKRNSLRDRQQSGGQTNNLSI